LVEPEQAIFVFEVFDDFDGNVHLFYGMPKMIRAEQVTDSIAYHGEGPFWDARTKRLLMLDVLVGNVVTFDEYGNVKRYDLPSPVATVIRRRTSGGFVIATEREVIVADEDFTTFETVVSLDTSPLLRTNDGGCDLSGAFIIGTMSYDASEAKGSVYRVSSEGNIQELKSGVTISNGVQWSRNGEKVFYIDTPTRRVDSFKVDVETGEWSEQKCHIEIEERFGSPDGMAIDSEGGLWIALWGGGAVNHYNSSGQLQESIAIPGVSQVSSCAFGGSDNRTLFVTTSRQGIPDDEEPGAGALFAVKVGLPGANVFEFSG
jgi:sugar lactone lactonase YvrE